MPTPPLPTSPRAGTVEPGWLLVCTDGWRAPVTLVVVGEADLSNAGQLRDALLDSVASHPDAIVVDLKALEFCGLAGLDALHAGLDAAQAAGVVMTVRGMSTQLRWLHATFPRQGQYGDRSPRAPLAGPAARPRGTSVDTVGSGRGPATRMTVERWRPALGEARRW